TLNRIVSEQNAESVLRLVAPFEGTVVARDAVVGDVATMGDRLFSVADIGTLWLCLAVSEKDVAHVRVGQRVDIRTQSLDREIDGRVTWISSQLNETTRMAEVRAEVANPDRLLRAGMFVDATITVGDSATSLLLPRNTVFRFGGNPFVFVRLAGGLYEVRRVEIRPVSNELTAITAGLTDRDLVAVEQSYLLKSEFQKSRLGAGCVD
ncbi:MAG: efflux RND transporter periplasmic adaptor subunit, partial [Candidatus Latescibacterota bacterium]